MNSLWFLFLSLHIRLLLEASSPPQAGGLVGAPVLMIFQPSAISMECETAGLKGDLAASSI